MFYFMQQVVMGGSSCAPIENTNFDPIPDVGDGYDTDVINHYWEYGLNCWIISSSEMGTAKQLTGLTLLADRYSGSYAYSPQNQYIKIAHTTDSALPSGTMSPTGSTAADKSMSNILSITDETLVASGTFAIPNLSAGDYHTFSFNDNNFCYNGSDNIVIFWINNWGDYSSGREWWAVDDTSVGSNNRGAYSKAISSLPTSFSRQDTRPVTRFTY